MSGEDAVRDVHVVSEQLIAPPVLVPEPVPAVQVENDPDMEVDSDEDPSEYEEETDEEDVGLPAGVINALEGGVVAARRLGGAVPEAVPSEGGAVPEAVPSEGSAVPEAVPSEGGAVPEAVPSEGGSEGENINPELQEALAQLGHLVYNLVERNTELHIALQAAENRAQLLEARVQQLQEEAHVVNNYWEEEIDGRHRAEDRVLDLEHEVRVHKRKVDKMTYAYTTSIERAQDRIWFHPEEIGQTHHTITRARVIAITEEERASAMARGLA